MEIVITNKREKQTVLDKTRHEISECKNSMDKVRLNIEINTIKKEQINHKIQERKNEIANHVLKLGKKNENLKTLTSNFHNERKNLSELNLLLNALKKN